MAYNPNIPNPGDLLSDSQSQLKNNFQALDNVFAVDHFEFSDSTANKGFHKQVRMINQATVGPALGTANGALFAGLVSGNSWPIWKNSLGSTVMLSGPTNNSISGYVYLPGSILLQWGRVTGKTGAWPTTDQTQNFNTPFNVAAYTVYTTFIGPTSNSTGDICINTLNAANFHWQFTGASGASFDGFYWLAIGQAV